MNKNLPRHIAIIPDGNRRWARSHNLPTLEGHRRGFNAAVKISRYIRRLGISTLTLWAFSTENWNRSKNEVKYLMNLYSLMTDKYFQEAMEDEVKVTHMGRKDRIPRALLKKILNIEEKTRNHKKHYLNIGLDYGGRDEVIRAIQRIYEYKFPIEQVSSENFNQFLETHRIPYPEPDLVIRTSGEHRTSGFMIWQAAYAEYIFLDKYFPDIDTRDIDISIEEYLVRKRRFGK